MPLPAPSTNEKILVVENDLDVGDLIARQALMPLGYRVELAGSASAAIQMAVTFAPDVVIASLHLPGLSGKDLLVALSSQGVDVPVIMLARKGMEGDLIQAFRLGAADYLVTPVREAEVVSAVERVLKQVRARREREQLAVQLKRTNDELQRRVRELTTIFSIGKAVVSITDQRALFDKIIEGAVYVAEADMGWFLLRDERTNSYIMVAQRNLPQAVAANLNKPWDDGISSLVALSGEPLTIHGDPIKRFKVARLGQSALVVPIKIKDEVVGLLVVLREKPRPFSGSNQNLLEAVADYASISLVNARLFRALEDRARSLQQAAEAAQVSERIKGEILQNVSHELRTPLMAAIGYVDVLLDGQIGNLSKEQMESLKITQQKLQHLASIVENMTSLNELDMPKKLVKTNLKDLARQALGRFQHTAQQNGVALLAELPAGNVFAMASPAHIAKVFDGLLSNAIKFSPQGGQVTVQMETLRDGQAHVIIQDSGTGIDPKHLPRIFDPFYQADGSTTRRFGGLGIGLALVKEIIEAHKGKVWAESTPGKGSKFHFSLPGAPV